MKTAKPKKKKKSTKSPAPVPVAREPVPVLSEHELLLDIANLAGSLLPRPVRPEERIANQQKLKQALKRWRLWKAAQAE